VQSAAATLFECLNEASDDRCVAVGTVHQTNVPGKRIAPVLVAELVAMAS
jgi:hypothetical protein